MLLSSMTTKGKNKSFRGKKCLLLRAEDTDLLTNQKKDKAYPNLISANHKPCLILCTLPKVIAKKN